MVRIEIGDDVLSTEMGINTVLYGQDLTNRFKDACYVQGSGEGEEVEDQITLELETDAPGNLAASKRLLVGWIEQARLWNAQRSGDPVYLQVTPEPTDDVWLSEILDGRLEPLDSHPETGASALRLHLKRRNYWERHESQAPLTNAGAAATLDPIPIYNHSDAGHSNYADIAPADVAGDLPAAARLEMTCPLAAGTGMVFIGVLQHEYNGALLAPTLEGESASGGSLIADADCSGGSKNQAQWTGTTATHLLTWTLTSAQVNQAGGRYFKGLLRLKPANGYTDLWLRLGAMLGSTLVWAGPWVLAPTSKELFELPPLMIPPYRLAPRTWYAEPMDTLNLALYGRRNAAGTHTLTVDYLQLFSLDGWRKLVPQTLLGTASGETLVDDGMSGLVYIRSGGKTKTNYAGYGEPIRLLPGIQQRIEILQTSLAGETAEISRSLNVKLFYQPRRRCL